MKIHVWASLTASGFGRIDLFTGVLNALGLCGIYERALLPTAEEAFGKGKPWVLQEDNDPKHRSARASQWRREHEVERMD